MARRAAVNRIAAAYERLVEWLGILPGFLVGLVCVGTGLDLAMRFLGIGGMPWMIEVEEYVLFIIPMLGAAYVMRMGRHVTVEIVPDALPPGPKHALNVVAQSISLLVCVALFWFSLSATVDTYHSGSVVFKTFTIPEWVPLALLPPGMAMLAVECLRRLLRTLSGAQVRARSEAVDL